MNRGVKLIMLCLIFVNVQAQNSLTSTLEKINKYNKEIDNINLGKRKMMHYDYNQTLTMWDSIEDPNQHINVKLWFNDDHLKYLTKDIEVYQDTKDAFMIIHSRKMVIWSNTMMSNKEYNKLRADYVTRLKDTILKL